MSSEVEFAAKRKEDKVTVSLLKTDKPQSKKRKSTKIIGIFIAIIVIISAYLMIAAFSETWPFQKEAQAKEPEPGVDGQRNIDDMVRFAQPIPISITNKVDTSQEPIVNGHGDVAVNARSAASCISGCEACWEFCWENRYPNYCCYGAYCCCYATAGYCDRSEYCAATFCY